MASGRQTQRISGSTPISRFRRMESRYSRWKFRFPERTPGCEAHVWDYGPTVDVMLNQIAPQPAGFRCGVAIAAVDDTARRGNKASAFHGATPTNFRRWLCATLRIARSEAHGPETAVFINSWNEWAEGTYLEQGARRVWPCLQRRQRNASAETVPTQRDRHLRMIAERGRMAWQKASGYNLRANVEASIGRYKRVTGSRANQTEATDVAHAAAALNRMLGLGRPNYVRIA